MDRSQQSDRELLIRIDERLEALTDKVEDNEKDITAVSGRVTSLEGSRNRAMGWAGAIGAMGSFLVHWIWPHKP